MKKDILRIGMGLVLAAVVCLLPGGCKKAPINNDFEGMWILERFTTRADNEVHACERMYISIQLWVMEVAEKQGTHGYGSYIGRCIYDSKGESIRVQEFYQRASTGDNGKPATAEQLMPWGMNSTETTFKVLDANGKRLVLQSDYAVLELKRF